MSRGQRVSEGFVNFPMNDPAYEFGDMGCFVKLVVIEPDDLELAKCCGVAVFDMQQEPLVFDDQVPPPKDEPMPTGDALLTAHVDAEAKAYSAWLARHYPRHEEDGELRELSRHYRASIVMGSSGWNGYSPEKGPWGATYDDLTEEGKALYQLVQKLNPGCTLHLLTFVDT